MADEPLFTFDDDEEEQPAVLGKMDALIARHRGNGPDPSVPVLTDLAPNAPAGEIPVLTHVEPVIGEDLMFTPEEIRPDDFAPPAPSAARPQATAALAPQPATSRIPPAHPAPAAEDLIAVPPLTSRSAASSGAAPVPTPAPVARPAPAAAMDFPDLVLPTAKPAAPKPAPVAAPPAVPSGQLMPELSLNFDFALPADEQPKAAAAPAVVAAPVPAPAPIPAAPVPAPVQAAVPPPATRPGSPDSRAFPMEEPIEISLDDEEPIDAEALATELMAKLQPAMEKLVRMELARQSAAINVEVLKRTLGAIQPQLHKLIAAEVEAALKRQ